MHQSPSLQNFPQFLFLRNFILYHFSCSENGFRLDARKPISEAALLLYACTERSRPFFHFSFCLRLGQPEMPPDAGHGKRESAPATISACHVFPTPNRHALLLPIGAMTDYTFSGKCRRRNTATASHARMAMTGIGLPSRWQES